MVNNEINSDYYFDNYIVEKMSLNNFFEKLSLEKNGCEIVSIDDDKRNLRTRLSKILQAFGMESILNNKLNQQGQAKIFPIYQLLFFRRVLLILDLNEPGLVKKVSKKKYKDIEENDILSFSEQLTADFELWNKKYFQKYNIKPIGNDDLFTIFSQKEAIMAETEEDGEILMELFGEPESDDLRALFLAETIHQEEELKTCIRTLIEDKKELDALKDSISKNLMKEIDKIFELETIQNKSFESLDKYKSKVGVIDVPIELLNANEIGTNKDKLFLLHKFSEELENLCIRWNRYISDYPRILDNQRIQFAQQKSNEKPDRENAFNEAKKRNSI